MTSLAQPYDPSAEQPGSKAINKDSPVFKDWASACKLVRGPGIITYPDSVEVTYGEAAYATGKAGEGKVVSLGDGGKATLYFDVPIGDGPGPDFAVFENSFNDLFLELAFVEVSSDSINFVRFSSVSLTQVEQQVGTFGMLDATNLFNLAGKYKGGYGTPFNLSELQDQPGLNINNIVCVRIIDVIGILIDSLASHDSRGVMINDPWPTPFESGGFDLDAVGVINNQVVISDENILQEKVLMYPNPVESILRIKIPDSSENIVFVYNIHGKIILEKKFSGSGIDLQVGSLQKGLFTVLLINEWGKRYARVIEKL